MKILCSIALFATVYLSILDAGQPPDYTNGRKIFSSNKMYYVTIDWLDAGQATKKEDERKWVARVTRAEDGKLLWEQPYKHRGYVLALLSDDGLLFADIEFYWTKESTDLIAFYHPESINRILAEDIPVKQIKMGSINNYQKVWLRLEEGNPVLKTRNSYYLLQFYTIDEKFQNYVVLKGSTSPKKINNKVQDKE